MRARDLCSSRGTYLSGGEGVGGPVLSLDSEAGECDRDDADEGIIGRAMPEITNLWASRARRSEVEGRRDGCNFL